MKALFCRLISELLVLSMSALPFAAQAALVGTGNVLTSAQVQTSRDKVLNFVARANVQDQLQMLGLNPDTVKERVNALTDEEIQRVAGKIDSLPAGAYSGWEVLTALVVVGAIIYILWK